jgi:hypothetical protein
VSGELSNGHGQIPDDSLGPIQGGKGSGKSFDGEQAGLEAACPAPVVHVEANHGEVPRPAHDESGLFQHFSPKRRLSGFSGLEAARWETIDIGRVVPLPLKEDPAVCRRNGERRLAAAAGDVLPQIFLFQWNHQAPLNPKDAGQPFVLRVFCPGQWISRSFRGRRSRRGNPSRRSVLGLPRLPAAFGGRTGRGRRGWR